MQQSKAIAYSGMITALSFIFLMMTGLIPFGTFLFPTIAGIAIVFVKVEYGYRYALTCYGATSLLCVLFCPDKTAMIVFVLLLGYYPIFKIFLEHKVLSQPLRIAIKTILYVLACALGFFLLNLFFPAELYAEGALTAGLIASFFILGAITFFIYDIAINQILAYYIIKIKNRR